MFLFAWAGWRLGGLVVFSVEVGWLLRCGVFAFWCCLASVFGLQVALWFGMICDFLVVSGFGCLVCYCSSGFRVFLVAVPVGFQVFG